MLCGGSPIRNLGARKVDEVLTKVDADELTFDEGLNNSRIHTAAYRIKILRNALG